jgi:hypothetical protein
MAHALARLRIAVVVTHAVARLTSGLRVFALAGRDSHPLDEYSEFPDVPNTSFPPDQPFLVTSLSSPG